MIDLTKLSEFEYKSLQDYINKNNPTGFYSYLRFMDINYINYVYNSLGFKLYLLGMKWLFFKKSIIESLW